MISRLCVARRPARGLPPCLVLVSLLAAVTSCAPEAAKIVFVPGELSHGYGMHEHRAGLLLVARSLKQQWPELETVVTEKDAWPPADVLADADAIVMACEGSKHVALPHIDEVDALADRGVGIAMIHYAVEPPEGPGAEAVRRWIGGNHERGWSINPDWATKFTEFPDHPAANGLEPFSVYDEWYFHMRFVSDRKGITPILETRPQLSTLLRNDGPSSNNPNVRESVLRGERHAVAWAYERPGGGRGFGFTGAHHHHNYRDDNFRKTMLNGVAWVAHLEVPPGGVESAKPTWEEIAANQDYEKPEKWEEEAGHKMSGNADPVYSTPPISARRGAVRSGGCNPARALPPHLLRFRAGVSARSQGSRRRPGRWPDPLGRRALPWRAGKRSSPSRRGRRPFHRTRRSPGSPRPLVRA